MASALPRALSVTSLAAAGLLALTGCGLQSAAAYTPDAAPGSIERQELPDDAEITVVAKNFTEQLLLGKIAVIAAKAAGYRVIDMTNVPGSQPARELMLSGEGDVTWDYTGTAWLTFLGHETGIADQTEQWRAVRDEDSGNGLSWLEPAPMNNTYALAVRSEAIEELGGITKLSQLAELPIEERTFCVEPEFNSRVDGITPMLDAYGLPRGDDDGVPQSNIKIYDTGAVYTATDRGNACNFGEVFTTDGRISKLDLTILEDDLGFFPAYNAAPVINTDTLERFPGLADVYSQVAPALTDEVLRELNLRVDDGGEEPADVAYDFLLSSGFISEP